MGALLMSAAFNAQAERLKDIASISGVRSNQLIGYALVVGLNGTGDQPTQTPLTLQPFNNRLSHFGIKEIARAHVRTPVTNAHLVCRLLLETKPQPPTNHPSHH